MFAGILVFALHFTVLPKFSNKDAGARHPFQIYMAMPNWVSTTIVLKCSITSVLTKWSNRNFVDPSLMSTLY